MEFIKILENEYRDSLFLLKISNEASDWERVYQAVIGMGSTNNKSMLELLHQI